MREEQELFILYTIDRIRLTVQSKPSHLCSPSTTELAPAIISLSDLTATVAAEAIESAPLKQTSMPGAAPSYPGRLLRTPHKPGSPNITRTVETE